MEMEIQVRVPMLRKQVRWRNWVQSFEMTPLAYMWSKTLDIYRNTQWVKMSSRFESLFGWIWVWILILIPKRTLMLILILIWLDCIDVGLSTRRFAWTSKVFLARCKDLSLMLINPTIIDGIFDPHSTVAQLFKVHDRWGKYFVVVDRQDSFYDYVDLVFLMRPICHLRGFSLPSNKEFRKRLVVPLARCLQITQSDVNHGVIWELLHK